MDETVWLTTSDHKRLHARLRKEGKCKIPVDVLHKISHAAYHRTEKCKEAQKTDKIKKTRADYNHKNKYLFAFKETIILNVELYENIQYNLQTGHININSYFQANNSKQLFEVIL